MELNEQLLRPHQNISISNKDHFNTDHSAFGSLNSEEPNGNQNNNGLEPERLNTDLPAIHPSAEVPTNPLLLRAQADAAAFYASKEAALPQANASFVSVEAATRNYMIYDFFLMREAAPKKSMAQPKTSRGNMPVPAPM